MGAPPVGITVPNMVMDNTAPASKVLAAWDNTAPAASSITIAGLAFDNTAPGGAVLPNGSMDNTSPALSPLGGPSEWPVHVKVGTGVSVSFVTDVVTVKPAWSPVTLAIGDRLMVNAQGNSYDNGVYFVQPNKQLARDPDFATAAQLDSGAVVQIDSGDGSTFITGQRWYLTCSRPFVLGITPLNWILCTAPAATPIPNGTMDNTAPVAGSIAAQAWDNTAPISFVPPAAGEAVLHVKTAATALANPALDWVTAKPAWSPVNLVIGDRVLLKFQTNAYDNGVYIIKADKTATRAPEAATSAQLDAGLVVQIDNGDGTTFHTGERWYQFSAHPVVMGTTNLYWFINSASPATVPNGTMDNTAPTSAAIPSGTMDNTAPVSAAIPSGTMDNTAPATKSIAGQAWDNTLPERSPVLLGGAWPDHFVVAQLVCEQNLADLSFRTPPLQGRTIDGVVVQSAYAVLLIGQTDPVENGLYWAYDLGQPASRLPDSLVTVGVRITAGTNGTGRTYACITPGPITPGTTPVIFQRY